MVKYTFLGMIWICFGILARERAPNFMWLSSSDIYELMVVIGYWYLAKVPLMAEKGYGVFPRPSSASSTPRYRFSMVHSD